MNPESNYVLFVKALLRKGYQTVNISQFSLTQITGIEEVAADFYSRHFVLDAIQTYYMTKNVEALNKIGEECLKNNRNEFAFEAFRCSANKEGLSRTGDAFLKNSEVQKAHTAFKLAENRQMIEFIEKNFDKKF